MEKIYRNFQFVALCRIKLRWPSILAKPLVLAENQKGAFRSEELLKKVEKCRTTPKSGHRWSSLYCKQKNVQVRDSKPRTPASQ